MYPLNGAGSGLSSQERGKDAETGGPPRGGGLWNPDGVGEGGIPVNCPMSKGGEEGTPVATRPARLEGTGAIWLDGGPGLGSNRLGV